MLTEYLDEIPKTFSPCSSISQHISHNANYIIQNASTFFAAYVFARTNEYCKLLQT
jgi:hypothetical protein